MSIDYGKVAVLMGGLSNEREVSLKSGEAVFQALKRSNIDVVSIDVDENIYEKLKENKIDRVFNVLHGRGGEDGQMQALLDFVGLPYTGSNASSSALAMDKLKTKKIWLSENLPTPAWKVLGNENDCSDAVKILGLPLIVKPILEGSSVGVAKVNEEKDIVFAWEEASKYGVVIAEQFIDGDEYTTAVLQSETLPVIRLEPANDFYDYAAKYLQDDTKYHCPCGLSREQEDYVQNICMQAFDAIGASGWGRVDFMMNKAGEMFLIELNTVPGMTDHSLVPIAANEQGISFEELVLNILDTSVK